MAAVTAVEHLVLFKVMDGTDPAKVDAMISNLRSLASLDGVLHLAAAPLLRRSPAAAALGFTHLLHSRYRTKPDLAAYSGHPAHLAVVREFVLPICDDIMAVDWVGDLGPSFPVALRPGSAARVTLAKLKEGAGEGGKEEVMAALGGVKGSLPGVVEQFSYGENFSPARAKGFSIGSMAVFAGPEVLDGLESKGGDLMEAAKATPLLESVVVVDFLVLPPPAAASGL